MNNLVAFVSDVSPKVKAGLNWGTLAALVAALTDLITPETFAWAGPLQPLLFALAPLVIAQVAAWVKTDPFREAGKATVAPAAQPAASVPPTEAPTAPTIPAEGTTPAP